MYIEVIKISLATNTHRVNFLGGSTLRDCIKEALSYCRAQNLSKVVFDFNGLDVEVFQDSNVDAVENDWVTTSASPLRNL